MRRGLVSLLVGIGTSGISLAQSGYTISGSESNFDCGNHCDYACDEMEVQIDGIRPEDVLHTYTNGNYGAPSVTLSADGTYTIVDYRHPQHLTEVNSIEHFGITIKGAVYYGPQPYHPTRLHWYRDGHIATVNGQIPNPGGGSTPATQPLQPSIYVGITPGTTGAGGVALTVTNNDPVQSIWIQRSQQIMAGSPTLEALMPNNPVVTNTVPIDNGPVKLSPLQSMTAANDLIEIEEEQSSVFVARYFQNVIGTDPFNPNNEAPGPELGNVMTATVANPQVACAHSIPTITSQPASVTTTAGARIDLRVTGKGDDASPLTYVWMKEGVPINDGADFAGTTTNHLRINSLSSTTEGFYSVQITNTCASILSDTALVFETGHNDPPTHAPPTCPGNVNGDAQVDLQDLAILLSHYGVQSGATSADGDMDGDGDVDLSDLALVLANYGHGC